MSGNESISFAERLQTSVVKYLYDNGKHDAASALLTCDIEIDADQSNRWYIVLYAPTPVYDQYRASLDWQQKYPGRERYYSPKEGGLAKIIEDAFKPFNEHIITIKIQTKLLDIDDPDWKSALQRLLTGDAETNQGLTSEKSAYHKYWQGMHFGSASELEIAKALDRKGVMYFPGCLACVGAPDTRSNKEPDFLVCHQGKWGILEVDGKPFHPPERTAKEHERGRQFKYHGVKVVEHFDANFCREQPDTVVEDFLKILEQT